MSAGQLTTNPDLNKRKGYDQTWTLITMDKLLP